MEITKICEKIKERRKALDMTQKELADAMHVSNQLISKWETGESVPALEYMQLLSEVLQTSVQYLMGMEDSTPKPDQEPESQSEPVSETSEPVEPVEPDEPEPQAPQEKPSFWKKNRKPLLISIISVAAAILATAVVLLSYFVFAPAAGKKNYVKAIDNGIDEYLTLGYYNLRQTTEVDGDKDVTPRVLQGYIDENGNAAYYNSVTGETVKDKMKTKYFGQSDYVQPESIKTVADLFKEQITTLGGEEPFEEEYLRYIRKEGSKYYLEFKDEFFTHDMKPSEKKNIELTETIKGEVVMYQKMTESISVTVRYRNVVSGEKFSIASKIELVREKPQIEHEKLVQTVGSGLISKEEFLKKIKAVSVTDSMSKGLEYALSKDRLCYENGYAFYWSDNNLTVVNPKSLSLAMYEVELSNNFLVDAVTVCDGAAWCVRTDSYYSSDAELHVIDLQTGTAQYRLHLNRAECFFRNHYLCGVEWTSSGYNIVYDLETQKTIFKEQAKVLHVDADGNIYYIPAGGDVIRIYGQTTKVLGKEFVKEEDGCVFFKSGTALYRYKNGILQEEIYLPSSSAVYEGDYCFVIGSNTVTKKSGAKVYTFDKICLKTDDEPGYINYEYSKILAVHNGMCLVVFMPYENALHGMMCLFKVGEWDTPVAYTNEIAFDIDWNLIRLIDLNGTVYAAILDSPILKEPKALYRLE